MRRNPKITKAQARAMKAVLRAHGYLPKRKKAGRRKARRTHRRSRR